MSNYTFNLTDIRNDLLNHPKSTRYIYPKYKEKIDELFFRGRTSGEKLYMLKEGFLDIPLCSCGKPLKFYRFANGYHKTCGDKSCIDKNRLVHIEETCLAKYGVTNGAKLEESKRKSKETYFNRTGYEHNSKNPQSVDRMKKTMIQNWGVEKPLQNKELSEKRNSTALKNNGTLNFIQCDKTKETMIAKYGTTNVMKIPIINNTIGKTQSKNRYNEFIERISNETNKIIIEQFDDLFLLECKKCNNQFLMNRSMINSSIRSNNDMCKKCNPVLRYRSKREIELFDYIKNILPNDTEIIPNKRIKNIEIDVFIPSINIGFEFNGVYWHSDKYKTKDYHLLKFKNLEKENINLIQIWEDDWVLNNNLIKNKICNIINNKVFKDNNFSINDIGNKTAKEFHNKYNLESFCFSKNHKGLFINDELFSVLSYSENEDVIKIVRISQIDDLSYLNKFIGCLKKLSNKKIIYKHSYNYGKPVNYLKKLKEISPDFKFLLGMTRQNRNSIKLKRLPEVIKSQIKKIYDCGGVYLQL